MTDAEVVETLTEITRIQAGVINELFQILGRYVASEELDSLPVIDRINLAAGLRAGISKDAGGV